MTDMVQHSETLPVANTAAALLQQAIDKGMGVEAVEKLVELMERMEDRAAAKAFHAALAAFQEACPPIPQTATAEIVSRKGGGYSYTYAPLDVMAAHLRPHLRAHGFAFRWDSGVVDGMVSATCYLGHEGGHTERATFTAPVEKNERMSGAQHHAAALTYAKRQSLVQVLGITTTDPDPDGKDEPQVDEDQVVALEELWELLTHNMTDEQKGWSRVRVFPTLDVKPRNDGEFYFADVPRSTFEKARNLLQKRIADQEGV